MEFVNAQSVENDVNEMEVLTGARLFQHLCIENEEKQRSVQGKLNSYMTLQETLHLILAQSRHKILAPVAEGLAYFDAELYNTNSILVLLGDGWFVERSASQACEITARRINFLEREMQVLREEAKNIEAQRELLMTEISPDIEYSPTPSIISPSTNGYEMELLSNQQEAVMRKDYNKCHTTTTTTITTVDDKVICTAMGKKVTNVRLEKENNVDQLTKGETKHNHNDDSAANNSNVDAEEYDDVDEGDDIDLTNITDTTLTTFDVNDELTEDELIELEHELGEQIDNDELVEKLITEKMIAKKEKRVRAELARRRRRRRRGGDGGADSKTQHCCCCEEEEEQQEQQEIEQNIDRSYSSSSTNEYWEEERQQQQQQQQQILKKEQDKLQTNTTKEHLEKDNIDMLSNVVTNSSQIKFVTPGDIGVMEQTCECEKNKAELTIDNCNRSDESKTDDNITNNEISNVAANVLNNNAANGVNFLERKKSTKRVTFAPDVKVTEVEVSSTQLPNSHRPARTSYTIGDVVEHLVMNAAGSEQTNTRQIMPELKPVGITRPKRKSLFRREMEGNSSLE